MAISFVAAASAASSSVALPAGWQAGDLAIAFARRTSSSYPGTNANWTQFYDGQGASGDSVRLFYRVLQTGDTTVGSFSSATTTGVVIYRGVDSIGAVLHTGASSGSTIDFPALTLTVTDGTSWVLVIGSHRTATDVDDINPTGTTNRTSGTGGLAMGAADTNGGVSSWSATSDTVNASHNHSGYSVELVAADTGNPPVELQGSSDITFAETAMVAIERELQGSSGIEASQTAILVVEKELAAAATLDFGTSADLLATARLAGSSDITFAETGSLTVEKELVGASDITFGQTATLFGEAILEGSSDITFGETATLDVDRVLEGSSGIEFSATGSIPTPLIGHGSLLRRFFLPPSSGPLLHQTQKASDLEPVELAGTSDITFGQSADLVATAALAGSTGISFTESADLRVVRGLGGVADLTFGSTAILTAVAALAGTTGLSFTESAALRVVRALAGSSSLTFGESASLLATARLLASTGVVFTPAGILRVTKALDGDVPLVFSTSATLQTIRALAGTSGLTFTEEADLNVERALEGSSDLTFGATGSVVIAQGLYGATSIDFGTNAILRVVKPLAGASEIAFSGAPVLLVTKRLLASSGVDFGATAIPIGSLVLQGASSLTFTHSASLQAIRALQGVSGLTTAASAALTVIRGLAGTSDITFGQTANLRAGGQIDGTTSILFAASAALAVSKRLQAQIAVAFDASADLFAGVAAPIFPAAWQYRRLLPTSSYLLQAEQTLPMSLDLQATTGISFSQIAQLQVGSGEPLAGTTDITFGTTAVLKRTLALAGTTSIAFEPTGALASPVGGAAVEKVQTASQNSGLDPMVLTVPEAVDPAHFLVMVVSMRTGSSGKVASITDDGGNVWTWRATGVYGLANTHVEIWTSPGGNAASTFTFDLPALRDVRIALLELSGIDADNPFVEAIGTSVSVATNTVPAGSVTLPEAGLAIAAINTGGSGVSTGVSNGYTLLTSLGQASNLPALHVASKAVPTGPTETSFSFASSYTAGTVAIGLRAAESLTIVELSGTSDITFEPSANLSSPNELAADDTLTFTAVATLETGMTGTASLDFDSVADLSVEKQLGGFSTIEFSPNTGLLGGTEVSWRLTTLRHNFLFEDPALRLQSEREDIQPGALAGTASMEFGASASLSGEVVLGGLSSLTFSQNAVLSGGAEVAWRLTTFRHNLIFDDPALRLLSEEEGRDESILTGTASVEFTATANLGGAVQLGGLARLEFSQNATLVGGTEVTWRLASFRHNLIFDDPALRLQSENIEEGLLEGWLEGASSLDFSHYAELATEITLSGTSSIEFSGTLESGLTIAGQTGIEFTASAELSEAVSLLATTSLDFGVFGKLYEGPPKEWERDIPPPDAFLPRRRRDSFNRPIRECERLGVPKVVITSLLDGSSRGTYICEDYSLNHQLSAVSAFSFSFSQAQSKHILDLSDYLYASLFVGERLLIAGPVDSINFDQGFYKLDCTSEMAELTKIRAKSNAKYTDEPVIGILYDLLSRAPGWEIGEIHTMPDILVTTTVDLREEKRLFAQITKLLEQVPGLYLRYVGLKTFDVGLFDERVYPPIAEHNLVGPIKHTVRYAEVIRQIEAFGGQWTKKVYSPFVPGGPEQTLLSTDTYVVKLQRALAANPALASHPEYPIVFDNGTYVVRNLKVPASVGAEITEFYREIVPEPAEDPTEAQIREAAIALWQRCVAELKKHETMEDQWTITTNRLPCELYPGDRVYASGRYQQIYYDPQTGESSVAYLDEVADWFRVISIDENYGDGVWTWSLNVTPNAALPTPQLQSLELFDQLSRRSASSVITQDETDPYEATSIPETYVLYTINIGPDDTANSWIGDPELFYPAREESIVALAPAGYTSVEIVKLFTADPFDDAQIVGYSTNQLILRVADNQDWDESSQTTAYVLARYS